MIGQTWLDDLKRKQGEQVFLDAMRDYATGELQAAKRGVILARVLSIFVLATPFLVAFWGVLLSVSTLPSWGGIVFGMLLVATGYVLCPTRYRVPKEALSRDMAPILFAQLDEVSAALNAPKISHVVVTDDFNAFVTKQGGKTVLGVGALLWEAAPPDERVALVAHEMAHLVNDDPARGKLMLYALQALEAWEDLLAPGPDGNVIADVALFPFRVLIAGLEQAVLRPMFLQSQRAEYLADALAAEVAGSDAVGRLLRTVSLGDGLQQEWNKLYGLGDAKGRGVVQRLSKCLHDMEETRRKSLLEKADKEKLSVDATHPPTAYRRAFVETVASDGKQLRVSLVDDEDPAFLRRLDVIGERLAVVFDTQ